MNNIDKEMMRESQAKEDNESKNPFLITEINIKILAVALLLKGVSFCFM